MLSSSALCWHSLNRLWSRSMLIGMLTITGLASGLTPGLSKDFSTVVFSTAIYAQSAEQITKYARAVLQMEPVRQTAYQEVRRILKGSVPGDVCRQGSVPRSVKDICSRFYTRSAQIILNNGLSIGEFNEMTRRLQGDAGLRSRIQQEMRRQQGG